jgi:hypothetical protein
MRRSCRASGARRCRALYRDAPEAKAVKASGERIVRPFIREALPEAQEATRVLAGDLMTTLSAVGKQFSEGHRTVEDIETYAGHG